MCLVEPNGATANIVNPQSRVDPFPKIRVLHRYFFAEPLPLPISIPPILKPLPNGARNLLARGNECYRRGLIESFESAHDREQLKSLMRCVVLDVVRFELQLAAHGFESKIPATSMAMLC